VNHPVTFTLSLSELEFILRLTVGQFVWLSGLPLGPLTRFYLALLFLSDNYLVLLSKASSLTRIRVCSLQCNHSLVPITIFYRLICDCVPFLSPLTTRRNCGGSILTRLTERAFVVTFMNPTVHVRWMCHTSQPQDTERKPVWRYRRHSTSAQSLASETADSFINAHRFFSQAANNYEMSKRFLFKKSPDLFLCFAFGISIRGLSVKEGCQWFFTMKNMFIGIE
jgi:hypothetical protein